MNKSFNLSIFTLFLALLGPTMAFPAQVAVDTPSRAFPGVADNHPMIQHLVAQLLEKIAKAGSAEAQVSIDPVVVAFKPHLQVIEEALNNYIIASGKPCKDLAIDQDILPALLSHAHKECAAFIAKHSNQNLLTPQMVPEFIRQFIQTKIFQIQQSVSRILQKHKEGLSQHHNAVGRQWPIILLEAEVRKQIETVNTQQLFRKILSIAQDRFAERLWAPLTRQMLPELVHQIIVSVLREITLDRDYVKAIIDRNFKGIGPLQREKFAYVETFIGKLKARINALIVKANPDTAFNRNFTNQERQDILKYAYSIAPEKMQQSWIPEIVSELIERQRHQLLAPGFTSHLQETCPRMQPLVLQFLDPSLKANLDPSNSMQSAPQQETKKRAAAASAAADSDTGTTEEIQSQPIVVHTNQHNMFEQYIPFKEGYDAYQCISGDGTTIVSRLRHHPDATLHIYNRTTGDHYYKKISYYTLPFISNDGSTIGYWDDTNVCILDRNSRVEKTIPFDNKISVNTAFFSDNNKFIFLQTADSLTCYDKDTGNRIYTTLCKINRYTDHLIGNDDGSCIIARTRMPNEYGKIYNVECVKINPDGTISSLLERQYIEEKPSRTAGRWRRRHENPLGRPVSVRYCPVTHTIAIIHSNNTKIDILDLSGRVQALYHIQSQSERVWSFAYYDNKLCLDTNQVKFIYDMRKKKGVCIANKYQMFNADFSTALWFSRQPNGFTLASILNQCVTLPQQELICAAQSAQKMRLDRATKSGLPSVLQFTPESRANTIFKSLPADMQKSLIPAQHAGPGPSIPSNQLQPTTPSYLQVLNNPTSKIACTLFALYCWRTGKLQLLIQRLKQRMFS